MFFYPLVWEKTQKSKDGWLNILNTEQHIILSIYGSAENNIFAVGYGMIYHFNGTDWYRYQQFTDANIAWSDVWGNGDEIFIIGKSFINGKTLVLHGK